MVVAVLLGMGDAVLGGVLLGVSVTATVGVISGTAMLQAASRSPINKTTTRNFKRASSSRKL